MNTLFVKKLTTLDFSFLCPHRGVVGETWIVDIFLHGKLNKEGMLIDFSNVKKQLKLVIDSFADHKLLVPLSNPHIICRATHEKGMIKMKSGHYGRIEYESPLQAMALLNLEEISASTVTVLLKEYVKQYLSENVTDLDLYLYPEETKCAYYHYSHGLKKHTGDCQRIAHGHRSKIEIMLDGHRSAKVENEWAALWQDIYLASLEDISAQFTKGGIQYTTFSYTATQGKFTLTLPSRKCYLIESDTTVELLSEHVAKVIKKQNPNKSVNVTLYEGIDKGAVSCLANI